ncbi:DUF5685 family protein [Hydrogenoanaerobacterium sp.]|uniref:DUF5685 family protein n=1 Tax=Hydrogenoanaerobacterium sp. TaxID=2953763 RepID=UPI00289FDAB9|nr:DUF5685 family protein [Hydrogenoanaerobacterium sp.]
MFGYIKPFKPQMRICEYDTYKAVYCGLCKQLGSSYGLAARFTLSYDFAFFSILSMSLQEESPHFCKERCFANPLKKKYCCRLNESSLFSACTAMILLYYKVDDNYRDSKFWGKLLMLLVKPFASSARKKAMLQYPQLDAIVAEMMRQQYALEQAGCSSIDEAAQPTALSLAKICELLGKDDSQKRILNRFGYLLGRWVYLIDAVDDLEDDMKSGSYNAFVLENHLTPQSDLTEIRSVTVAALNQTAAEIAKTYELLELKRYKPILDNVIYFGLKNSLHLVEEKRSNTHDRSL